MLLKLPDIDFGPWTKWVQRENPRKDEVAGVPLTFGCAGLYLLASWPASPPAATPVVTALPKEVLYVGKSRHPGQRLLSHEKAARYAQEQHDWRFQRLWVALWDSGWTSSSQATVRPIHEVTLSACEDAVILLYTQKHGKPPPLNGRKPRGVVFPK